MDDGYKILNLPTAIIQSSGLSSLSRLEMNLFWRIIGLLQDDSSFIDTKNGVVLTVDVRKLYEHDVCDRQGLINRLEKISNVTLVGNLDGRDSVEHWSIGLKLVCEWESRSDCEYIHLNIGTRFYQAVRDKTTYTKIRSAALFEMRSSKYSSRLYTLIRDKVNLNVSYWVIGYNNLRLLLHIEDSLYKRFGDFRDSVLDAAIREINVVSELEVTWRKSLTYKNQVREITFEWNVKRIDAARKLERELGKARISRFKEQEQVIVQSEVVRRAIRELSYSEVFIRQDWADRFVRLGYGKKFDGMCAKENLEKWVDDKIAAVMVDENFIRGLD